MTDEDKKLIAEYMGWYIVTFGPKTRPYKIYVDSKDCNIHHEFDPNCAGLCVAEMQKRGEWVKFHEFTVDSYTEGWAGLTAWLFNADNFFAVMNQWLEERGK